MNIEEAVNYLKENLKSWKDARPDLGNTDIVEEVDKDYKAIETLLTAYEKEKEKNKTLEELLQGRLFELYKYYKDLASEYQGNCVSKDKIKPIQIIDLDGKIHNVYKIEEE